MSDYYDSQGAQTWIEPLPGGGSRTVRRYSSNFLKKQDKYDVHYVQFSVPGDSTDIRFYYDEVVTSSRSDFWTATEVYMEVDGGRELMYRNSKETNEHRESAHFHFDQDGYNTYYNGRRVRFVVQHGNERADSALALWVDQYS